ncbi:unnamed protein product [Phyllotreta striolata]|uniref:Cytochrome P450 n=1 Tax=Phyllotreta striolata TaxID=444603 RepID=A0A9N9XLE3_PHYSR|nr:unnamed protein product [Phyllotreta striolata]
MFIYIIVILYLSFYIFKKWRYNYWQSKGVYATEPNFPYGHLEDVMKGKKKRFELYDELYKTLKKKGLKHGGLYEGLTPTFVPVEQDLIKRVFLKDFQHFVDHGTYSNPAADPLTGGLFQLEGEPWRNHRAKLTPTFTTGKMKMMFHAFVECSRRLDGLLEKEARSGEPLHVKEILARFTSDIIGSVAFGIECNCMNEPDNEFRRMCTKAFNLNGKLKKLAHRYCPHWMLKALHFKLNDPEVEKFFFDLVSDTIKYREDNKATRKDFLQMLIELKNTGSVSEGESVQQVGKTAGTPYFSLNEIVAHSFTFFLAGFETSATTMCFMVAELVLNPDVQEKLRKEIWKMLEKHNGELTYDAINEMVYLEQVLQETLRKYPPIPIIPRICTKTYRVPGDDLTIEKGTSVQIPVRAIQRDPDIYPDPDKFDPDRWNPENNSRSNSGFYTFGEGPRVCIGMRFGKLEAKCGIIALLKNYKLTASDKMQLPLSLNSQFISGVEGGVWVNMEKITKAK